MRSLTPTALSVLPLVDGLSGDCITRCAIDPETNDVYATIEKLEDGVEVTLVKYEVAMDGRVQNEVSPWSNDSWTLNNL
jgi:hypothetical protein